MEIETPGIGSVEQVSLSTPTGLSVQPTIPGNDFSSSNGSFQGTLSNLPQQLTAPQATQFPMQAPMLGQQFPPPSYPQYPATNYSTSPAYQQQFELMTAQYAQKNQKASPQDPYSQAAQYYPYAPYPSPAVEPHRPPNLTNAPQYPQQSPGYHGYQQYPPSYSSYSTSYSTNGNHSNDVAQLSLNASSPMKQTMNNNSVVAKDGMKLSFNLQAMQQKKQEQSYNSRGKGTLASRVFGGANGMYDQPPSQSMPMHTMSSSPQPLGYRVDPSQFYHNQQMMMSQYGLQSMGVDRQLLMQNSRNFQQQRANLPPSRVRGCTTTGSRSYSRSYDSYRDEISDDDDFIDNRELDEITDSGEDDTLSDDADSIRDIRSRKRKRGGLEFEKVKDDPVDIIEAPDGGHVTRSRASTGVTIRKSYSRENLQDSDETDDDVDTHDTQEEDDLSEDMDDSTGGGLSDKAARGQSDGKKRVSKLEQLMALCEEKVEKLTGILATNGLEYEKLKNTAIAVTLPLVEEQPKMLSDQCKLTRYQLVGFNWLWLLYQGNLNGILADEMGLGKTLQTIAIFALLKEKNYNLGPHLVVVPSSTLTQWHNEIVQWCPSLRTVTYHGDIAKRKEIRSTFKNYADFDIMLTTYQLIGGKSDKKLFKNVPWHYLVLDEAQNIKNGSSLRFQALFKIKSIRKLLLTGTPLQNNLQELWSLLHFLMSDEFEKLKIENYTEVFREFRKTNEEPRQRKRMKLSEQNQHIQRLKKILEPFILRRLKIEVSLDLSAKIHRKEIVDMTETQRVLYAEIYMQSKSVWTQKQQQKIRGVVNDGNKSISFHNFLNNLLMQLRKVSNHPLLLRVCYDDSTIRQIAEILLNTEPQYKRENIEEIAEEFSAASDWELHEICSQHVEALPQLRPFLLADEKVYEYSGKMLKLKEVLEGLKAEGHRVLLFSQMTKMMNILGCYFDRLGYRFVRLDGSTPVADRQVLIDKFNNDPEIFIFLLSTRAGGLGINLSSADTVIFYDISFNPQVDRQAEDRCHRLGQKSQVNVITLLTKESCEEQIWEMAHEKKELNDIMLEEGDYSKKEYQDGEATYEIIEEKEEELGTDAAMQVVLNQLFGEVEEKETKSTKKSKSSSKKDKKAKESSKKKEKKEKEVKEKKPKVAKPPVSPAEGTRKSTRGRPKKDAVSNNNSNFYSATNNNSHVIENTNPNEISSSIASKIKPIIDIAASSDESIEDDGSDEDAKPVSKRKAPAKRKVGEKATTTKRSPGRPKRS